MTPYKLSLAALWAALLAAVAVAAAVVPGAMGQRHTIEEHRR